MAGERATIPWLKKRNGVHYVYWYDTTTTPVRTKRLSLGTGDDLEAQKRYAAFLAGGTGVLSPKRPAGLTVWAALDDYLREHIAEKAVDQDRAKDIARHLKAFWEENDLLKTVDIPASRAYAAARREGKIGGGIRRKNPAGADSTIRRELVVLRAAAGHALRWKRITAADMPSLELPAEGVREEIWLTQAEMAVVLGRATGRLKDFLMLLYYTGARRSSIERLTRFQIDLKAGRINLSSPKETKLQRTSKKRRPVVPLFSEIRPTVERLMGDNKDSEYLFGDPRDMYRDFVAHLTALGLAEKAFPHIVRHSRATHLLQDGVDLYAVARLLGDTVATVERVYGHHSADYLEQAIQGRAS